jgi:hypothetical protein
MATDDPDDPNDQRAKDVLAGELDPKTRADLERWFGLPSFEQLAEQGATAPEQDIEITLRQERQQKALEAVDPAMLEAHRQRTEPPEDLFVFRPSIDVLVDPSIAQLDLTMVDATIAEPRYREIPEPLLDDLKTCTPQALLRDLHRPEIDFEKIFEVVDMAAEQTLDIVAEVAKAMATNWKLPPPMGTPYTEVRQLLRDHAAELRQPWAPLITAHPLPNRKWTPEEDR